MARLPIPGSDDGQWGTILNDFLTQTHNADGSLKPLAQSQVINLENSLATKLNAADVAPVATSGDYNDLANKPAIPDTSNLVSNAGLDGQTASLVSDAASQTSLVLRTALGAGDWRVSRAFDAVSPPRKDDQPTTAWTNSATSGLTSPVVYRPSACGTGSQVNAWDGKDDPNFAFFSGSFQTLNGATSDLALYGMPKPDATTAYRWPVVYSFTTSAISTLELAFYGAVNTALVVVEVNGRLVDDTAIYAPASFTTGHMFLTLTFPSAQVRTLRIWTTGGLGVYAVRVPTGATISKPAITGRRVAVIGDSFVNGAGNSNSFPSPGTGNCETFAPRLGRMLGAGDMILAGIGGSGWVTAGSGSKYTGRLDEVLAMSPDVLIFYGSTNDGPDGTADLAAIQTEVASALTSAAAVDQVYVIGPLRGSNYETVNDTIEAATEAAGRTFLDLRNFIGGSGKSTAPAGDGGNADFYILYDGVHPNLDAHRAIARQLFALMYSRSL